MENRDKESGMIMIEAVYVVVIAIMIIFFSVNVAAIYHNRIVVTAVANEAASGIAEIYGCTGKEPFYAYVDESFFEGRNIYRYVNERFMEDYAEAKGKWYAGYLISTDEFTAEKNRDFSDITVKCEENGIGVQTVTVTVKRKYQVFTLLPVTFWNLVPEYEVEATGTAVCYDPIHQMNVIAFRNEIWNTIDSSTPIINVLDTILELIDKIMDHVGGKGA